MNKNRPLRKTLPFVIAMAIALTLLSGFALTADAAAPNEAVSNEAALIDAVNAAPAGPASYTIALKNDIELTDSLIIPSGKNIILISGAGGPFALIGTKDKTAIYVTGKLTLGTTDLDGIIVTHKKDETGRGVVVNGGGVLIMNTGEISGNTILSFTSGGGVFVASNGVFEISGGVIENNTASYGGGVAVESHVPFEMSGGVIENNTAKYGGGVYVEPYVSFKMSGGVIGNNSADSSGGGIYFERNVSFEMSGGVIEHNSANMNGGGVYTNGGFIKTGGTIANNEAVEGGGVYVDEGTFGMYSGTIANNSAQKNGGGVWITDTNRNLSHFTIPADSVGVVFSNNRASAAYDRNPADDGAYKTYIIGDVTWSEPFTQGYNNYDISYVRGQALTFYTVSFDLSADEDAVGGLISDSKPILFEKPYGKLPALFRSGYIFDGWFTEAIGGEKVVQSTIVMIAENHILYAQWTEFVDSGNKSSGSGFGQAVITENNKNGNDKNEQNNSGPGTTTAPPANKPSGSDSENTQNTGTGGITGSLFWMMVLLTVPALAFGLILYKNRNRV